jgi:hypothetical protein
MKLQARAGILVQGVGLRIATIALAITLLNVLGGCGMPAVPARTVADLLADPAVLQGVMARCSEGRPSERESDPECVNARIAVERQAREQDAANAGERHQEFERKREALRARDERVRAATQAAQRTDVYTMPVVTPDAGMKLTP